MYVIAAPRDSNSYYSDDAIRPVVFPVCVCVCFRLKVGRPDRGAFKVPGEDKVHS